MITFDKLKLVANIDAIEVVEVDKFEKVEKAGRRTSLKFFQETPFLLMIKVDYEEQEVVVEFCGKVLGRDYPKLISSETIKTCFENINALGFCHIDVEAMMEADVVKADVTKDVKGIDTHCLTSYFRSHISNYKAYVSRMVRNGNCIIEKNVVTRKMKKRMTIYDKEKEMQKVQNKNFVEANHLEHAFDNTCRFELNLNSKEQVRTALQLNNNKLKNVLASSARPILDFVNQVVDPAVPSVEVSDKKAYLTMLVLKDCDYDLEKVEAKMRELYPARGTNFKKIMEPYRLMVDQLNHDKGDEMFSSVLRQLG